MVVTRSGLATPSRFRPVTKTNPKVPSKPPFVRWWHVIDATGLEGLLRHRYRSVDHSIASRLFLTPFWQWWISPNMITLVGFIPIVILYFVYQYYSPSFTPSPELLHLFYGLALFWYQTLDNVDGRQARRTKTSSPLGELFDHGLDALNTALTQMSMCSVVGMGPGFLTMMSLGVGCVAFWISTWETYHSGALYFAFITGPHEGILVIIATCLVGFLFGNDVWFVKPFPQTVSLNLIQLGCVGLGIMVIFGFFASVVQVQSTPDKRYSTLKAFFLQLPVLLVLPVSAAWAWTSPTDACWANSRSFMALVGFLYAYCELWVISWHMTMAPWGFWKVTLPTLPMWVALINANAPRLFGVSDVLFDEVVFLRVYVWMVLALTAWICFALAHQITNHLNLPLLRMPAHAKTAA